MTIAQEIYAETLDQGGTTKDLLGNVPTTGYMVSEPGGLEVPLSEFSVQDVEHVIAENKNALYGSGGYIGTWTVGGTVYIDYSVNIAELGNALAFGRRHGQKAIYSLNTRRVICL